LTQDALSHLSHYAFPGNVRELENLLHRAVALSSGEVIVRDDLGLPEEALADVEMVDLDALQQEAENTPPVSQPSSAPAPLPADLVAYLDAVERDILVRALERHRFNRTAAGASLGLSLRQMRYRMARLGINVADHLGERGEAL
ncbi:MAG TPA: helix-turn-helix domain-containing protein, partial [Burkholderiaceae bacterium]|nr:helix-turn-helix domain-containing protein [Burkholderiaceae bacterium]